MQKFCLICSAKHDIERKTNWARENPLTDEQKKRRNEIREIRKQEIKSQAKKEGSEAAASNICWQADCNPDLIWVMRTSVPFDYGYSKNAIWSMATGHHVFLRKRSRQLRDALCLSIKSLLQSSNEQIVPAKVWVDILVQKPDHKGDAINVVDSVCDALKEAIGLDDRWFSIRRLDWEIVKENPRLYVGFGQETNIPQRVCSYCGLVKAREDNFPKRKHDPDGFARICFSCQKISERVRSKRRRAEKT